MLLSHLVLQYRITQSFLSHLVLYLVDPYYCTGVPMNVSLVTSCTIVPIPYSWVSSGLSQRLLASVLLTLVRNGSYVTDKSKSIEDYLADEEGNKAQLSHGLLKKTVYLGTCLSRANEEDQDGNHQTNEMCQALYNDAAKCKVSHGMTSGFYDNEGCKNQVNQEAVVCNFVKSMSNSSSGEISIYWSNSKDGHSLSSTSTGQAFALSFSLLLELSALQSMRPCFTSNSPWAVSNAPFSLARHRQ